VNPSNFLKTFLSGLVVSLPIVVTIAVIVWLFVAAESVMGAAIKFVLPQGAYITGMGLATGLVVIFLIGLATRVLLFQSLVDAFENLLNRIPLVKTLYGAARDLMDLFSRQGQTAKFSKMVAVAWPGVPMRLFGFITVEDFSRLDIKVAEEEVAVYMPLSYQIGGYMALIPRQHLEPVDMSLEEGMRFVVTAGMSRPQPHGPNKKGDSEADAAP